MRPFIYLSWWLFPSSGWLLIRIHILEQTYQSPRPPLLVNDVQINIVTGFFFLFKREECYEKEEITLQEAAKHVENDNEASVCVCVCIWVYWVYACVCVRMYGCMCVSICVYGYMCVCICIYVCVFGVGWGLKNTKRNWVKSLMCQWKDYNHQPGENFLIVKVKALLK